MLSPGAAGDPEAHESDNVAQLVDVLSAGVDLDDRELFAEQLRWIGALLSERTGSAAGVGSVLEFLAGELPDFPVALASLAHGQEVLDVAGVER